MDFSSLSESQKQQLQQIQQQFKEHQQKQQEEAAAVAAAQQQQQQSYDQSSSTQVQVQVQPYDPSSLVVSQSYDQQQSYYPYYQYQQDYAAATCYYQAAADYSNAYQQYSQPEDNLGIDTRVGHIQNTYDPYQVVGSDQANQAAGGLNDVAAAAMAALSQLTQFAGNMDAAERAQWYGTGAMQSGAAMHPPVGHAPYGDGGRRGGGPPRGGFCGNTGNRGPPFRWRGRGRGRGGQRYPPHSMASSSRSEFSAAEAKPAEEGAEGSAVHNGSKDPGSVPIRIAWCELCRVDCTSLEILEQHKNGKRHKKNLQKLEGMKNACLSVAAESQDKIVSDLSEQVPEIVKGNDGDNGTMIPEKKATDIASDDTKVERGLRNDQADKPWMKRKMRGGQGGCRGNKRMKASGRSSRQPPKPKIVIPLICDLCNVKCDTQEVFDRHVAGKKHIAKLKRFEGHQAMYGATGVQALYPPNPIAQTLYRPQQARYGAQGTYPPPETYIAPLTQNPNPELSDAPLEFGSRNAAPEAAQQSGTKQVSAASNQVA